MTLLHSSGNQPDLLHIAHRAQGEKEKCKSTIPQTKGQCPLLERPVSAAESLKDAVYVLMSTFQIRDRDFIMPHSAGAMCC